jgi:hypothetical protein
LAKVDVAKAMGWQEGLALEDHEGEGEEEEEEEEEDKSEQERLGKWLLSLVVHSRRRQASCCLTDTSAAVCDSSIWQPAVLCAATLSSSKPATTAGFSPTVCGSTSLSNT